MKKTEKNFKIHKILNNSSLIVRDSFHETVFIGRGIAFGLKVNDVLPKGTPFEQRYQASSHFNQFSNLLMGYTDLVINMVMDTIQLIVSKDNKQFDTNDFRTIADHLAAAYTRIIQGQAIQSFFSFEIRALYPNSYIKAEEIAYKINVKYGIVIPEGEVGYIALHIENLTEDQTKEKTETMTVIVSDIYDLLTVKYQLDLESKGTHYLRFLTHIRFLVEGTISDKRTLGSRVDEALISTYPQEREIAAEIVDIVQHRMGIKISKEELTYILIHLVNLTTH